MRSSAGKRDLIVSMFATCISEVYPSGLVENQVSDSGFQIQVDHRESSEVVRRVREHDDPDLAGDYEHGSEHESCDHRVFDACYSLIEIMGQSEHCSADRDDDRVRGWTSAHQCSEPLEQKTAIDDFFAKPGSDNQAENGARKGGAISSEVVVRRIDGISAEQRHQDRL